MKTRQWTIIGVAILIIIISFGLAAIFGDMKEPPKKELVKVSKKYVRTTPVIYSDQETSVVAYGRVRSAKKLDLIAEVSGRMFEGPLSLKEGEIFRKGMLLYYIDDTEARFNLNASKSTFLRDLATILPDLKIDFKTNYPTWREYFESVDLEKPLPQLPIHKSEKERTFLATKNIFNSYYTIKSTEANLRKYRFYAPFSGSISSVAFESGSFVNPGNKIGTVVMTENLELKVDVNVDDIGWVSIGSEAIVTDESNSRSWKGVVKRIGNLVNEKTQSINVYIGLKQNEFPIFDGNYLRAEIPGEPVKNSMVVDRGAIFRDNKVYVLQDSTLRIKSIDIHRLNTETAIISGLKQGTDLVSEPLVDAHDNMKAFKIQDQEIFSSTSLTKN